MAMTKKDFWAIANAVAETKRWMDEDDAQGLAALGAVSRQLANACAAQYQGGYGFKRALFLEACGFPQD
jgi:hypothetical protein